MDTPVILRALPVALAPAHRGGRGGRLLLRQAAAGAHRVAGVQHGAGGAQGRGRSTGRRTSSGCSTRAGACWCSPRARARATATSAGCAPAPRCSRPQHDLADRAGLRRRHARRDAGRPRWMRRGPAAAAGTRRDHVRAADPPRPGEHRTEVMERVRPLLRRPRRGDDAGQAIVARAGGAARRPEPWPGSSSPAAAASSAARWRRGCSSAGTTSSGSPARTRRRRRSRRAGARPSAATCSTRTRSRAGWRAATLAYHVAGVNTHCPPDPEELLRTSTSGGAETVVRAAARAGVRRVVLHVLGRLGGRAQGDGRRRGHRAPRLLPVGLRPLQARGRAGGVRRRAASSASRSSRSTRPRSRDRGARRATASSSSTTSTASCRCSSTPTSASSTSPTSPRRHILAAERGRAGARYVLNGATIAVARGARASSPDLGRPPPRADGAAAGRARRRPPPPRAAPALRGRTTVAVPRAHPHDPARPPLRRLSRDARARPGLHAGGGDVPPDDRVGGGAGWSPPRARPSSAAPRASPRPGPGRRTSSRGRWWRRSSRGR